MDWPEWRSAVTKVLLALVPSLFKVLWDHWPKTPAEKRALERGSGDDDDSSGRPASP